MHAPGVLYLLDGSVRRTGKQVRIYIRLVGTDYGEQLWAERFDRRPESVFAPQDEVARQIVAALALILSADKDQQLRENANVSIYNSFLLGRRHY